MSTYTQDLETAYLKTLQALIQSTAMTADVARDSVSAFMQIFPIQSDEDLREKVDAFTQAYPLWTSLQVVVKKEDAGLETDETTEHLRNLLHSRKIDELLLVASRRN